MTATDHPDGDRGGGTVLAAHPEGPADDGDGRAAGPARSGRDDHDPPAGDDRERPATEPVTEEFPEDALAGRPPTGAGGVFIHAPGGNINTGALHGDQRVVNDSATSTPGSLPETYAEPVTAREISEALHGFTRPAWFASALRALDDRVLFLVGRQGSGRRTAALNLLHDHRGPSFDLRVLDGDTDLASWRPIDKAHGYLVPGLTPRRMTPDQCLGRSTLATLRRRLAEADARMVVVLPDQPHLVRPFTRQLDVKPIRCQPPPTREVFTSVLAAEIPDEAERRHLVERAGPTLVEELLDADLTPVDVTELVGVLVNAGEDGPDPDEVLDRLSFLAHDEVPELLAAVREQPDALAFLLSACVFEGEDHRVIREEADRLLLVAGDRLHHVLHPWAEPPAEGRQSTEPEANPAFVLRRSLDDLLRLTGAHCGEPEIRQAPGYGYTVEPVRFVRTGQGAALLRHLWRQYSGIAPLLTTWLSDVPEGSDLTVPVGNVMGRAVIWGSGRHALEHVRELARSDRDGHRRIAAYALATAAESPLRRSEITHFLRHWSWGGGWRLRTTAALTCGTSFGAHRPDLAVRLLGTCYRGREGDERPVAAAVVWSLDTIFAGGAEEIVITNLTEWHTEGGRARAKAADLLPVLLVRHSWFCHQLRTGGDFRDAVIDLVHLALAEDRTFDATADHLLRWCRAATRDQHVNTAVTTLLTAFSHRLDRGVLRLFRRIDRDDTADPSARRIAHRALQRWRTAEPATPRRPAAPGGEHDPRS
ncbi:hypothetical protein [Streptomyces bohaiensis]|uniref:Uncharacterized protein n=1 Tax=Streptomyces bohaiensis TaxID=1431344 RepID=A0ABX1CDE3_9ACTN|nr:hypothetical protein [Streptomyces bohaiensis]NJQ17106.1 hypothetical protein [Streptomyces bohaiensis]